jgi:hypothetical protein
VASHDDGGAFSFYIEGEQGCVVRHRCLVATDSLGEETGSSDSRISATNGTHLAAVGWAPGP